MERRNKARHNLRLLCIAGTGTLHSAPLEGMTENMSRDGILMHWIDTVPLPEIGSPLTVEVPLPVSPEFGLRVMRCSTTVVRLIRQHNGQLSVGLRIDNMRFRSVVGTPLPDLAAMAPLTDKVN